MTIIAPGVALAVAADSRRGDNIKTLMERYGYGRHVIRRLLDEQGVKRRPTPLKGPTIRPLTELEAAYLAGLIDGEAHIQTRATTKGLLSWAKITLYNTDPQLIEWLGQVGGKTDWRPPRGHGHKVCGEWQVFRAFDVYHVLTAVLPHLRVKRELAATALVALAEHLGLPSPEAAASS